MEFLCCARLDGVSGSPIGVGDDVRAGVRVVFAFGLLILIELNG